MAQIGNKLLHQYLKTLTGNAIFDYKGTLFVSGSTNQMSPQYGVYIKK